jgi:hypothetical protein
MVAIDYTEKRDCFEKKYMGVILNSKYIRTHCKALKIWSQLTMRLWLLFTYLGYIFLKGHFCATDRKVAKNCHLLRETQILNKKNKCDFFNKR